MILVLATEAEGGGAPGGSLAVIILLAALAAFAAAYVVVGPGRRREPKVRGDIPLAMRPYHSDEELETTGLQRAMAWGSALAAFSAVFLPLYWFIEPARIEDKRDEFYNEDVAFGRALYQANCVTCHGEDLDGGFAPHPDPEIDAPWPAPNLSNIVERYDESEIVDDVEGFIIQTLVQGRPGTPMPAWGSANDGPMNDHQIESITRYILAVQDGEVPEAQAFAGASGEALFQDNCARCHGRDALGRVGPNLLNVYERYGAEPGNPASIEEAREAVRTTLEVGRWVPTVGVMPFWDDKLTPDAITRVVDYLESIQVQGGPRYGQVGGLDLGEDGE